MTAEAGFAAIAKSISGSGFDVRRTSMVATEDTAFCLADTSAGPRLLLQCQASSTSPFTPFDGDLIDLADRRILACPLTPANAAALRSRLAWLRPRPLERRTSAGLGDRLGLATPGHIRALRAVGGAIAAVLAQQSVRENTRTRRTPIDVLDAATWGAFAEGWQEGYGADADHLKTPEDIDAFVAAGYSWYTVDPGEFVNSGAERMTDAQLREALAALPWAALEDSQAALRARFAGRRFDVDGHAIQVDDVTLARAAVKYGAAVAHVARLYRHLAATQPGGEVDFEVSVDETDTPTSPLEHFYIARELARMGVRWTSLAPRFPGSFEKGIDYKGSIDTFREDFAAHAAIARGLGLYKMSLHSGSDKFSIYEAAAELTRGAVHLKTAGTSYLEALRTLAQVEPELFREIFRFALEHYDADRASYHVSASLARARRFDVTSHEDLRAALDSEDARQVLHVTYGSVLNERDEPGRFRFAGRLFAALNTHRDAYAAGLQAHFVRHLAPFASTGP